MVLYTYQEQMFLWFERFLKYESAKVPKSLCDNIRKNLQMIKALLVLEILNTTLYLQGALVSDVGSAFLYLSSPKRIVHTRI